MKTVFQIVSIVILAQELTWAQEADKEGHSIVDDAIEMVEDAIEKMKFNLEDSDSAASEKPESNTHNEEEIVNRKIASYNKKTDEQDKADGEEKGEDEEEQPHEKHETFKGIHEELSWMMSVSKEDRDTPYEPDEEDFPYLLDEEYFFDYVFSEGGNKLLSNKPWFIDFFAPWCGYSARLSPVWDKFHEVH